MFDVRCFSKKRAERALHIFAKLFSILISIGIFFPFLLQAQIIFVDPDALRPAEPEFKPSSVSLQVTATVLRFVPKDKNAVEFKGHLSPTNSFSEILAALGKEGRVDVLFIATRDFRPGKDQAATFTSLEKRSAFYLKGETPATNRNFGVTLNVQGEQLDDKSIALNWAGNLAWSPQFLNAWAGDKYLMYGMKLAQFVPGMAYTVDEENEDEEGGAGINLRSVFKSKKKKQEEQQKKKQAEPMPPLSLSFLYAESLQVDMSGKQSLRDGEFVIVSRLGSKGKDGADIIYLLLQPTVLK